MQLIKRVIQLAKDRALIKFSALASTMVVDAEAAMLEEMSNVSAGGDQRGVRAALQILRLEQTGLVASTDARFRESVERGMRTMYTDLRQGLGQLSANALSLIDDETVNRQLEVGHLVQRLRDACDENLGRLNIMIAQLHGDADVHERENPFRPYLIARALYESLKERVQDEEICKLLFARLSDSLAAHLSDYYAAICAVFDANGIQARLLARPTKLKRHQRDQLAQQLAAMNSPSGMGNTFAGAATLPVADFNPRVLPALQRMFESMGGGERGINQTDAGAMTSQQAQLAQSEEFQKFVWGLFNQASAEMAPDVAADVTGHAAGQPWRAPVSTEVLETIERYQRQAADAEIGTESAAGERNQLFSLGEKLTLPQQAQGQQMAINVVAVLFEFILDDEQIPAVVRARIARLQIPFLKAAMLEPQLLQQADHPARQLLNRIASAAVGLAPESAMAQRLDSKIAHLVKRILQDFADNTAIFSECLEELEQFLADQLANADADSVRSIQAAEDAEKFSAVLRNTAASLRDIVAPMEVDQRLKDFIEQIWARVLVRAAAQDAGGGSAAIGQQYREVLPELVWSAQEKTTPEDRNALMRLLPGLVKRLRIGMLMVHMPEAECNAALDRLVPVHTQVLRQGLADDSPRKWPSLDDLRKEFTRLVTSDDSATWILTEPLQVEQDVLESALADRGVAADVELSRPSIYAAKPSAELLSQLRVGCCVECQAGDTSVPARLIWVSRHHALFIFKLEQQSKPLVYSAASLLQALQSGRIGLVEYAPAFDRAVDALMQGAEALQARPAGG
ncbi:DUF1631 family protein [Noviherbaspirillum sedimenti]|uniref:DUF1631 family protein n=1 Tax=Noviherbaspirillum sedimenti TaxID=2320865 RepID=A0A3A3G353_9BURK|nr:DUF1631 family protein [Noviherbaspirillum sedimenti]RJG00922.1 DUF1631 family protein [Noviherbaspirillum sedimenti]